MQIKIQKNQVKTQRDAVLWHLGDKGTITSWEAIQEYGATRLAGIIHTLRKDGYPIISIPETRKNKFGNSVTISKYKYIPPSTTSKQTSLDI